MAKRRCDESWEVKALVVRHSRTDRWCVLSMLLYAIKSESEFELFRLGVTSFCGIISFQNFQKLRLAVDRGDVLLVSAAVGTE